MKIFDSLDQSPNVLFEFYFYISLHVTLNYDQDNQEVII
jgi:hypothetical protein